MNGPFLLFIGVCLAGSLVHARADELPTERELLAGQDIARSWTLRLTSDVAENREVASAELVRDGLNALPLLRRLLGDPDANVRYEVFEIIRRIGPRAIPLLIEMLAAEEIPTRLQAVSILIDFAPDTVGAQPALIRALHDKNPLVARDAARALGAMGALAAPAVPGLIEALAHQDEHMRIYSAEALASIGPAASAATPVLIKALDEPVAGVRWAACEALAAVGPSAANAVPRLTNLLKDKFLLVRICAAGALGQIGPRAAAAVEPLRTAATDPSMRFEAEWALERITGKAPTHPAPVESTAITLPPTANSSGRMWHPGSTAACGNSCYPRRPARRWLRATGFTT